MNDVYLCDDILFHILEYFDLNEIINVRLTCKLFNDLYDDNLLWKTYYVKDYNIKHLDLLTLSYKNAYKKCHAIDLLNQNLYLNKSIINILNACVIDSPNVSITKIPNQIMYLINLQKLDLPHNKITKIPNQIAYLINLRTLNLLHNRIIKITPKIGQLNNLRKLNLSWNKIKKVPIEISQLVNLQILQLSGNLIRKIPSKIILLKNLHELHFSFNCITEAHKLKILHVFNSRFNKYK